MSRKHRPSGKNKTAPPASARVPWFWISLFVVMGFTPLGFVATKKIRDRVQHPPEEKPVQITGPVTFAKDIAPILFDNCAQCHRPNGSGPFELLTYADVKKRAKDIARVTAARIMPPWQPERGYGEFEGERRLNNLQLAQIQKWTEQGAPEGNPAQLPPAPNFKNEWQLGQPDLIVAPVTAYKLPGE